MASKCSPSSNNSIRTQMFPPNPTFTQANIPSLTSKVYIITGATSGVGLEHAKMLYSRSATVYIAARSSTKIASAIEAVKAELPESDGRLEQLVVDLSDLDTVSAAAKSFGESRLDGLVLNAGIMVPPEGSRTKHGHELQMGTNCLGGYLLAKLLEPILVRTAQISQPGAVRVVWVASTFQISTPKGGVIWDDDKNEPRLLKDQMENYMQSKAGGLFVARDMAERLGQHGVISVCVNPGFMKTELQRNLPSIAGTIMGLVFKGPKFGAYSELFGMMSPEVTMQKNGAFIVPWGRFGELPEGFNASLKSKEEGGTGIARTFVEWCQKETASHSGCR